jgi:hypothetical protein
MEVLIVIGRKSLHRKGDRYKEIRVPTVDALEKRLAGGKCHVIATTVATLTRYPLTSPYVRSVGFEHPLSRGMGGVLRAGASALVSKLRRAFRTLTWSLV